MKWRPSGKTEKTDTGNAVTLIASVVGAIAAAIGIAFAWPDTWWPRSQAAPKVTVREAGFERYVVPLTSDQLKGAPMVSDPPCTEGAHTAWIESLGGVPTRTHMSAFLTTEHPESVVVTAFRPKVKRINTSPMRTNVKMCAEGGDGGPEYPVRRADLTLDGPPPRFRMYDKEGHSISRVGLNLGKGDAVEFNISAEVRSSGVVYGWTVDLELLVGGKSRTLTISDHGRPFRTAGAIYGGKTWAYPGSE
ncbi:hypothetical protein ACFVJH_27965 [Streptomyces decoyicus]|uniref:hypothetical protein n=1 Tax=Streptomyces decoyicus TaxID=249567 RepID=UPI00363CD3D4